MDKINFSFAARGCLFSASLLFLLLLLLCSSFSLPLHSFELCFVLVSGSGREEERTLGKAKGSQSLLVSRSLAHSPLAPASRPPGAAAAAATPATVAATAAALMTAVAHARCCDAQLTTRHSSVLCCAQRVPPSPQQQLKRQRPKPIGRRRLTIWRHPPSQSHSPALAKPSIHLL